METILRNGLLVATCLAASACAQFSALQYRNGPDVDLAQGDIEARLRAQDAAANAFIANSVGQPPAPSDAQGWHAVARTGFNYVRNVCDDYLGVIDRLQRDKDVVEKTLGAASIATTSILTAANAANALKYVAASLGLAISLNDAAFERYLFAQNVGVVQPKVDALMGAYEKTIDSQTLTSKADVIAVVRNDLQYCTPPVIEANLEKAISDSSVNVKTPDGTPVVPPGGIPIVGSVPASAAGLNVKASLGSN